MAHSTKRPATEGSRGRGDWMTVIEMQEYMGGEHIYGIEPFARW